MKKEDDLINELCAFYTMLDQLSSETNTLQIKVHAFYQPPSSQQLIYLPFPIKGELQSTADTLNFPAMKAVLGKICLFCMTNFPRVK